MSKYVQKVLIRSEEVQDMVQRLGKQITEDYKGKELLVLGILKGAFVFMSDLVRAIDVPLEVDFMSVSSYGNARESSGVVRILKDCDASMEGKHVLIVEDIVDTGLTLYKLLEILKNRNPASIELCTAFDKKARRKAPVEVKYAGIQIPDEFIVGYGLDFDGFYRNLPDVCVVGEEKQEDCE